MADPRCVEVEGVRADGGERLERVVAMAAHLAVGGYDHDLIASPILTGIDRLVKEIPGHDLAIERVVEGTLN